MTDRTQGSDQTGSNQVRGVFRRVMPNRTITGKKTDKPQFPSRMDGMDRAEITWVERVLKLGR